jgi:O-antigen ligase
MKVFNNQVVFFIILTLYFLNFSNLNGYSSTIPSRALPVDIFGTVVILFLVFINIAHNNKYFLPTKTKKILISFFLVLLLVSISRDNFTSSIRNFVAILVTYSLVITMSTLLHNIPLPKVFNSFLIFIFVFVIPVNLFVQYFNQGGFAIFPDRLGGEDTLRFGGALYHAHNAMVLGVSLIIVSYKYIILKKRTFVNISLIVILLFLLLLTDCRSIWGASIISVGYIYLKHTKYKIFSFISIFILGVYLVTSIVKFSSNAANTGEDLLFRQLIWLRAIEGIKNNPLKGYGGENYFITNSKSTIDIAENLNDPHNSFLDLFLQNGLPASIILIFMYISIYNSNNKSKQLKILNVLFIFWLVSPFFWGHIYKGTTGFITLFFPLTIFSIILHPALHLNEKQLKSLYSIKLNSFKG